MKNFLKKKGLKLGIAVLIVAIVVALSARALNGTAGFLTNVVGAAKVPVQTAATAVSGWLEGLYGYLYKYDQLKAENETLRIELAEAEAQARRGADAVEENQRLRDLLGFLEPHSDFVTESARVVSWNADNWSSTCTISKGETNGLEVGDAVITEYGALVGQITELGDSWATVSTVIDIDTNIGALVGDDGAAAMVIGNYALMQQGTVQLTYLAEGTQMFMDDTVMTSGMGGRFPQGLTIGKISSIQSTAGGQTEYGIITPSCDYSSLVQVFVIKEFTVVE